MSYFLFLGVTTLPPSRTMSVPKCVDGLKKYKTIKELIMPIAQKTSNESLRKTTVKNHRYFCKTEVTIA